MTIWILALVLFAGCGVVGWSVGIVRTAFSFVGLIVSSLLAWPCGHFLYPVLKVVGLKHPLAQWLLAPVVFFILVLTAFKIAGYIANRKVDVYYKYKAGDLREGLYKRLTHRAGLCLGMANAAIYTVVLSVIIYVLSYATVQVADADTAHWSVKLLNAAGKDLAATGLAKVASTLDPMPENYYATSDIAGLLYHNPLLESRLSRYPALLSYAEKPQIQEVANNAEFTEMRSKMAPIMDIIKHQQAQNIINDPDMLLELWGILTNNMADFTAFLKTGNSAKYDDNKILGRWDADVAGSFSLFKRGQTKVNPTMMKAMKVVIRKTLEKMVIVVAPDGDVYVKNFGKPRGDFVKAMQAMMAPPKAGAQMAQQPPAAGGRGQRGARGGQPPRQAPAPARPGTPVAPPTMDFPVDYVGFKGHWTSEGDKYKITFDDPQFGGATTASIEGGRLVISSPVFPLILDPDY